MRAYTVQFAIQKKTKPLFSFLFSNRSTDLQNCAGLRIMCKFNRLNDLINLENYSELHRKLHETLSFSGKIISNQREITLRYNKAGNKKKTFTGICLQVCIDFESINKTKVDLFNHF